MLIWFVNIVYIMFWLTMAVFRVCFKGLDQTHPVLYHIVADLSFLPCLFIFKECFFVILPAGSLVPLGIRLIGWDLLLHPHSCTPGSFWGHCASSWITTWCSWRGLRAQSFGSGYTCRLWTLPAQMPAVSSTDGMMLLGVQARPWRLRARDTHLCVCLHSTIECAGVH